MVSGTTFSILIEHPTITHNALLFCIHIHYYNDLKHPEMKITLNLKHLKTTIPQLQKCSIKIHIGDFYKIQSAESIVHNGTCNFMEINSITLDHQMPNYISFDFVIDRSIVARKSLFCAQAIQRNQVVLNSVIDKDKNVYKLAYELRIESVNQNGEVAIQQYLNNPKLKRRKTLNEESEQIPNLDQKNKIKYLQLSKITYSFAKRLDPMVKLSNSAQTILTWKMPEYTIGVGLILTLLVLFPKISAIFLCLMLIFGRNAIINKIQNILPRQGPQMKLLPPEENLQLLYNMMEMYCNMYEGVLNFLSADDRTKVITVIEIACKCGIVLTIVIVFLSLEVLIIMGIWALLFLTSSTGKRFLAFITPKVVQYNRKLDKLVKNVSKSPIAKSLIQPISSSKNLTEAYKQFYIYEYQRWWVAIQWKKQYYSNQQKSQVLQARMDPPKGYQWINQWKYQINQNTDHDGYQYTSDLLRGNYTPNYKMLFHVVRRRKWVRTCAKKGMQSGIVNSSPERLKTQSKQD